jgi:hypothetical protein
MEAMIKLIELWLPIDSYDSIKSIKGISFLTYKELIPLKVSSVKTHKFKNRVRVTIDTLIEGVSPSSLKELATLETKDEEVSFNIANVVVYGDDQNGYPIAHATEISHKYSSCDPKVRHLVVTGVHGNFKDAQQAFKRASRIKGSRVIKLRA